MMAPAKPNGFSAVSFMSARRSAAFALCFLLLLKTLTWITGWWLAQDVSAFQLQDYLHQFHHYRLSTSEELSRPRPFFSLWNYADSEFYMSIAAYGYPTRSEIIQGLNMPQQGMRYTEKDSFLKYAFFPLFPLAISAGSGILGSFESSAFVLVLIFSIAGGMCFLRLFAAEFPAQEHRQLPALILLFLYPFSLFYNLYHTESLFLLLSVLCFLQLHRQRFLLMWMFGFLLCLTRPNGIFIIVPLLYFLSRKQDLAHRSSAYACAFAIPLGVLPYVYLNWRNVGDPFFFATVQSSWGNMITSLIANAWLNTVIVGKNFMSLGFHRFHSSQLDFLVMLLFGGLLVAMWLNRDFPKHLVLWSTFLWLVPLVSKDLMSFSRYMSASFPVFMYLAIQLKPRALFSLAVIFWAGYFWALARVIHYQWVG